TWYKQLFDNLAAQIQNSCDEKALASLSKLADDVGKARPGTNLAAYGVYRDMWTRYAVRMNQAKTPVEIAKVQDKWLEDLTDFVKKYNKAEDTADALNHLAV